MPADDLKRSRIDDSDSGSDSNQPAQGSKRQKTIHTNPDLSDPGNSAPPTVPTGAETFRYGDLPLDLKREVAASLIEPGDIFSSINDIYNLTTLSRSEASNSNIFISQPSVRHAIDAVDRAIELSVTMGAAPPDKNASMPNERDPSLKPTDHGYGNMSAANIAAHGPILGLLPPGRRKELLNAAIGIEHPIWRGAAIGALGPGTKFFDAEDRARLVEAVTALEGPHPIQYAIHGGCFVTNQHLLPMEGLGLGLEALTKDQRSALVETVRSMNGDQERAHAVGGLLRGAEHLEGSDVEALSKMIYQSWGEGSLGDKAHSAIESLGPGAEHLSPRALGEIYDVATDSWHDNSPTGTDDDINKETASMVGGLGEGLGRLAPSQRERLFLMLTDPDELARKDEEELGEPSPYGQEDRLADFPGTVIAGWGKGMRHFSSDERAEIIDMVLDPFHSKAPDDGQKAVAMSGFGKALEHFEPAKRSALVDIVTNSDHPAYLGLFAAGEGIGGLAQGMAHLTKDERSRLVAAGMELAVDSEAFYAFAGLCQGQEHLNKNERDQVLQKIDDLIEDIDGIDIWPGPEHRALMIQARSVGMRNFADFSIENPGNQHKVETPRPSGRGLNERTRATRDGR